MEKGVVMTDNTRKQAFGAWYLFAFVGGGVVLPLALTLVFLFGVPTTEALTWANYPAIALVILVPIVRFLRVTRGEREAWGTILLAIPSYLVGMVALGKLTLDLLVTPYWNHTPVEYSKWIGPLLLPVFLGALFFLDLRLQERIKRIAPPPGN